jgi:hypothetical protein
MAALLSQDGGQAISVQTLCNPRLVVTSLRCDGGLSEVSAPIPAENALIVSVHLRDVPFHELKLRDAPCTPAIPQYRVRLGSWL